MEKILSAVYSCLYIFFLCAFLVLAVLSRHEDPGSYARDPPFLRPVRRMARYLYRKCLQHRHRGRGKGRSLSVPGEEGVRNDLMVLYPVLKARRQEITYRVGKIERMLLLVLAWVLLAGALHVRSLCSGILQENGQVERAQAGGADKDLHVKALSPEDAEEREDYGTYTVTVHARQYTEKEAEALARKILKQYPAGLLGTNAAADRIRTPLSMPPAGALEPFSVSWESSRYSVLDTDGSIFNSEYADDRSEEVELTMTLTYAGYRFQKRMPFVVLAPQREEEERFREAIHGALQSAEQESASGAFYALPGSAQGHPLTWSEVIEDRSIPVLLLGLAVCVLTWYAMDSRLHTQTKKRSRQLAIDYPQLASKLVLYLGAGMSVRSVFYKCAEDYRAKRTRNSAGRRGRPGKEAETRYLYEEILLVCNELESGISEPDAYMHFGRRCRSRQYNRLAGLLVQNLRRGNDTLLQVLQEEAQSSFEERKNLARELGEEAGTKLLLPMMLMLAVTMLIIIVPAYFGFSM